MVAMKGKQEYRLTTSLAVVVVAALSTPCAQAQDDTARSELPAERPSGTDEPGSLAGNEKVAELIETFAGRGTLADGSSPTAAEEAVRHFQVHEDFEIELVAAEPMVRQPLYMSWDHRGRMWVVQYLQYPFPAGLKVIRYDQHLRAVFDKVPSPPPGHVPGADRVTVLEDTDGDGTMDIARDVITGLNIATAVVVGRGGIWVLNPPYLLYYADADGDDEPDGDPEVHLSGFGLEDTHSVASSLRWGPDGWLYGASGSTTTGTIASAATKALHFKGQCIWRYHPESREFEIYAEGGGNTFSLEIDAAGRVFSGTNYGRTHGMHYAQGGYGVKSWGKHGPLTNPFAFGFFEHMKHEGFEERFSQAFSIYEGGAFPESYDHVVIAANALHNRVVASDLHRDTSSWRTVDRPPLVTTADRWFRPVDVKVGPDGAVYLADWYDSRLTHVDPRDNWHKASGRIYRLRAKGWGPISVTDLSQLDGARLVDLLLTHPNKSTRHEALRILGDRRDGSLIPELRKIVEADASERTLDAFWALNLCGGFTEDATLTALDSRQPDVRRWAVRLVGDERRASPAVARALERLAAGEAHREVRSQLASSARRLPAPHALPIVRRLLEREEDLEDIHIPLLLWWAIEASVDSGRDAVLGLFEDREVWSLPMVDRYILERLMRRYAMAGTDGDFETCARLLALSPGATSTKRLMGGLEEAFRGRQIANLPASLANALEEYQRTLGGSDLALALRQRKGEAIDRALEIIADPSADRSTRLEYIEILGQIGEPRSVKRLERLLRATETSALQRVTLQALMNYDEPSIAGAILDAYQSSLADEHGVRATAHRVLASRKDWTRAFLQDVDSWKIKPETISLDVVHQMTLHGDPEIDALVEKHWGKVRGSTPSEKQAEIDRLRRVIQDTGTRVIGREGDVKAGKALFTDRCAKCHTLFDEGGQAGPELTGYERDNLDFLLLGIVDPSAAIREEFTSFLVVTGDGRTLTGLIDAQDSRTVTLRDVENQTTLVAREQIERLEALPTSLMPEGLTNELDDAQVRDLFSYVMSRTPVGK